MSHENDTLKFGGPGDAIVMACPPDVNPDDDSVRHYGGLLVCESASAEWRRRIVACVNACAGIPTERLEEFNDWSAAGIASAATYRQQRDELLAALELMLERISEPPEANCSCHLSPPCADCMDFGGEREAFDEARAAIARVKGGAA